MPLCPRCAQTSTGLPVNATATDQLPLPPRKKSILVHNPNATNNICLATDRHDGESVKSYFSHGT